MVSLFDKHGSDNVFNEICSRDDRDMVRKMIDHMYSSVGDLLDSNYPYELRCNFYSRYWELYLGYKMKKLGLPLINRDDSTGPDFCLERDGARVWVEAIVPKMGDGVDAVPEVEHCGFVPNTRILLRITNAMDEKLRKWQGYIDGGMIKKTDAYVVAMNLCDLEYCMMDYTPPRCVSAMYPFGEEYVAIDPITRDMVDCGIQWEEQIIKVSGAPVRKDSFCSENYRGISGLLYAYETPLDTISPMQAYHSYMNNCHANVPAPGWWSDCFNQLVVEMHNNGKKYYSYRSVNKELWKWDG
jgi:hypothetical protein